MNVVETFKAARRVSTPLIAINSLDPAATIEWVAAAVNGASSPQGEAPKIVWDAAGGLTALNVPGQAARLALFPASEQDTGDGESPSYGAPNPEEQDPIEVLTRIRNIAPRSLVIMLNLSNFLENPVVRQALWNLRDLFKGDRRTLVMISTSHKLPIELQQDVVLLDEDLPDDDRLRGKIERMFSENSFPLPDPKTLESAVSALRGLALFTAEQATAISIQPETKALDVESVWARKKAQVEQTPGLKFHFGGNITLEDIGGLEAIKSYFSRLMKGGQPPRCIVFMDEADKLFAGSSGPVSDNTGVSQDISKVFLSETQDNEYAGLLGVGHPGTGKSYLAKALGASFGIPTITLDIGGLKGGIVGESEGNVRHAFKVIKSIAGHGGAFFIGTANRLDSLTPELQARFRQGVWFFDLPSADERKFIWKLNLKRFGLNPKPSELPDDSGWVGRDIFSCCDTAFKLGCSPKDAAIYISPVSRRDPESIQKLRALASGKFLSASTPGFYAPPVQARSAERKIDLG